jgi:hypothetical protein
MNINELHIIQTIILEKLINKSVSAYKVFNQALIEALVK